MLIMTISEKRFSSYEMYTSSLSELSQRQSIEISLRNGTAKQNIELFRIWNENWWDFDGKFRVIDRVNQMKKHKRVM